MRDMALAAAASLALRFSEVDDSGFEQMMKAAAERAGRVGRIRPHSPQYHKAPPGARSGRYKGSNAAKAGARMARKRAKLSASIARGRKAWAAKLNGPKASAPRLAA